MTLSLADRNSIFLHYHSGTVSRENTVVDPDRYRMPKQGRIKLIETETQILKTIKF